MIKQINVTFEFDSETELVSNVQAFVDGVEKKKTTTRKASTKKEVVLENEAIIVREDNKLVLNNKCANIMNVKTDDRIIIKYEKIGKTRIPIIGTDVSWDEEGSGNRLTKSNTVAYRGKANVILAEYGTNFTLEDYKAGLWKLVSTEPLSKKLETLEEVQEMADSVEAELLIEDGDNTEIEELTFKLQ
jgi:hypothetical protein